MGKLHSGGAQTSDSWTKWLALGKGYLLHAGRGVANLPASDIQSLNCEPETSDMSTVAPADACSSYRSACQLSAGVQVCPELPQ